MKADLEQKIGQAAQELFGDFASLELTRPEEQFGDYSTNLALQIAKQLNKNPREIAEALADKLSDSLGNLVTSVEVAGPGFINLRLADSVLLSSMSSKPKQSLEGKLIVAEYSDPNPFKVLHAGHLYTTIVGNAVANIMQAAGARVHRVNFGGDVGPHVAKTIWGILRHAGGQELNELEASRYIMEDLAAKSLDERVAILAERYVEGNNAFEDDQVLKDQIIDINRRVYELYETNDHKSDFAQIYWTCRTWSYSYFDEFYKQLVITPFEKYYPESETAPVGVAVVREQLAKGVYQESDGAIVFRGEPYGLHTRVFINSRNLPTYEGKEVGLIMKKWSDYHFDKSVIITGNDIIEYMKVVLKSIEQFEPELVARSQHLTHGQVKLQGGIKMSSRKGNVVNADDILSAAEQAAKKINDKAAKETANAAVKYAFLKQRLGGSDIIYSPEDSVALEGNSGPYLQYAHARARSVLGKLSAEAKTSKDYFELQPDERSLVRKITEYQEVVDKSVIELMPHYICTYLYELAQAFNRFYEHNRVIGDDRQAERLLLVERYAQTLKDGLGLLGVNAPEKM